MARPESLGLNTPVPLTRSSDADPSLPTTTAQPVRAPVLSNRPPSSQATELTAVDPARAEAAARAEKVRGLALQFFCRALGVSPGQAADAQMLHHYLQAPMDGAPLAMDGAWQEQLLGDGKFDLWIGKIREACMPIQVAGSAAYASVAMQRVFEGMADGTAVFLPVLYELGARLDHIALCAALDVNLDLHSLERLGSRLCTHFLCMTVLSPRLRVEPQVFPEPRPSADDITDDLIEAFQTYAQVYQQWLMRISERQLDDPRKDKLHRLLRTADLHEWMDDNVKHLEGLGPRRQAFTEMANRCLTAPLANSPMSFLLNCLLKVFESYPQNLERQVEQLQLRVDDPDTRASERDRDALARRRADLQLQCQLWAEDLVFIRRKLVKIAALDHAGKSYLISQLSLLAQAEYRPRNGAIDLRAVFLRASRRHETIAETDEPDQ